MMTVLGMYISAFVVIIIIIIIIIILIDITNEIYIQLSTFKLFIAS